MNFKVELPVINDYTVNIEKMGAIKGGEISNTQVINRAIQEVNENGGGHVVIPKGMWLTGPVTLLSGTDLHLENGAVLIFDKNEEEYPLEITEYEGTRHIRAKSPINADGAENISITGEGVINGNGELWRICKEFKFTEREFDKLLKISPDTCIDTHEGRIWFPTKSAYEGYLAGEPELEDEEKALEEAAQYYDFYRPVMVELKRCNKVLIEGVTLENSPAWNVHPVYCTNVTIRNAFIRNPDYAQNGDGLDVESCNRVEVYNVKFDVGDDAICMKSGKNARAREIRIPTENVYIHDCTVLHGHGGFVIGSEMSRGVKNIWVENCTFMGTDVGLRFKSALGRGGVVEDIYIDGINMYQIPNEAIIFTMGYALATFSHSEEEKRESYPQEDVPEFKNIHIKNVNCVNAGCALKVEGLDIMPVHDVDIENYIVSARNDIKILNGKDITLKNVKITSTVTGKQTDYKNEIFN